MLFIPLPIKEEPKETFNLHNLLGFKIDVEPKRSKQLVITAFTARDLTKGKKTVDKTLCHRCADDHHYSDC